MTDQREREIAEQLCEKWFETGMRASWCTEMVDDFAQALAAAERAGFRAALNKVTQDFADNVYEIGGDIGTNEVLAFLGSRIAHYPEAQPGQKER